MSKIEKYDSSVDTLKHIKRVAQLLTECSTELIRRANKHDDSKLESPEKEIFDEYTPKLKHSTYGSDEYKEFLKGMKVALEHHYEKNSHHPEHTFSNEKWEDIEEYKGMYQISNKGRVKRLECLISREKQGDMLLKEMLMSLCVTPKGYSRVKLQKDKKGKNHLVHTLVAKSFIGSSPSNRHQVNHKDGNKLNNSFDNLEYVTPSENLQHAYDNELREPNIKYVVYCKDLDITTFGIDKMVKKIYDLGYKKIQSGGIWRCINSDNVENTHLDLHFESYNINEYREMNSPMNGFDLFDLIEMFFDWKAATERHENGNIFKSIEINKDRFGISEQICDIFVNTANNLGYNNPPEDT